MSRSWLLSDKDIRELVGPDMFGSISSRDRAIAKAQFRKCLNILLENDSYLTIEGKEAILKLKQE